MEDIRGNLGIINEQIKLCAEKCGRQAEDVLLCAVSKTRTPEEINIAIDAGVTDIGENKVQELLEKYESYDKRAEIHFIGRLQTNKVKYIIEKVSLIHSLDRISLAEQLEKMAKKMGR